MQLALTELTGQPFADFMQATVLGPLQMTSSSYAQPPPPDVAAQLSRAHDGQGRAMNTPWHVYPEQAAAGLWTTPTDLARFVIEVQTAVRGPAGKVLSQASAREMTSPVGVGPFGVGLADRAARRGLVLLARWIQLGLPGRHRRPRAQGLRRGRHDQRRPRPRRHQRDRGAGRGGLRVGLARQAAGEVMP